MSFHTSARTLARVFAILFMVRESASSSVRRAVVSLGTPPSTAGSRLEQHRDIAHARGARRDRGRH